MPALTGIDSVIAAMTVGKDVSMLFTDVVNCMQTGDVEMKKLVYLYLINYAKNQPDLAILAVNTFVKVPVQLALLFVYDICLTRFSYFPTERTHKIQILS